MLLFPSMAIKEKADNSKLHSIESAGEFLGGLSPWTIRAWLTQGKLRRVKVGSRTMVRESELCALVRTQNKMTSYTEQFLMECGGDLAMLHVD
jgi:hypothetical protein